LNKEYNAVAAERERRHDADSRYESKLRFKRSAQQQFDENRWNHMKAEKESTIQRIEHHMLTGLKTKANDSSLPYNPITLQYTNTPSGLALLAKDNTIKHRAALRMQHMNERNNGEYNPITHAPNPRVTVPSQPSASVASSVNTNVQR
jgi:hypothetical protein